MPRAPVQVLILPYRRASVGGRFEYAIFRRADSVEPFWQFVAGGAENGETPEQAARRELSEETGLSSDLPVLTLASLDHVPAEAFGNPWGPDITRVPEHCFAVDAGGLDVRICHEHAEFRWVGFEEACGLLKWGSNRCALKELDDRLRGGVA